MLPGLCVAIALQASPSSFQQWLFQQQNYSKAKLIQNMTHSEIAPGAVIASPSKDHHYFYHWVRDAALVSRPLIESLETSQKEDYEVSLGILKQQFEFAQKIQQLDNRSGKALEAGLGEPRFNVDGKVDNSEWGRPQNDGPALRALLFTKWFEHLHRNKQYEWVQKNLSVLEHDLQFILEHWTEDCIDLWEEVRGKHFYTRLVQLAALKTGAYFMDRLGKTTAVQNYRSVAEKISKALEEHWDAKAGYLHSGLDLHHNRGKDSQLDISVILGVLHAGFSKGPFSVTDERILATAVHLDQAFKQAFTVNQIEKNWNREPLGTAIGRYPEDVYDGLKSTQGNPWFLATLGQAELLYRIAQTWLIDGKIEITPINLSFFKHYADPLLTSGVLISGSPQFTFVITAIQQSADAFMRRVQYHASEGGGMREQFNRNHGFMQGADELTWSHAAFLTALKAKSDLKSQLESAKEKETTSRE